MKKTTPDRAAAAPGRLPYDVRGWVGQRTLVALTLEVTTEFGGAVAVRRLFEDHSAAMLLTLLTYSYATGVFTSSEIERRTYRDEMMRYIAAHEHPNRDVLRSFRRRWRGAIRECLVHLFARVWQHRCTVASLAGEVKGDSWTMKRQPVLSPELTRHFWCEADRRIDRAVQYDSMELDE
jgi:hypothetical protein